MTDTAAITLLDDWRSGQHCPRRVDGVKKRRWWGRTVASVDTVLVHATGVAGGFGLSPSQITGGWNRTLPGHGILVLLSKEERESPKYLALQRAAHIDARLARYRETPYHGLYSPRDRVSVVQWPAADYTYHGDAANSCSVGWAYDGSFRPDETDALDVDGARESLRHIIRAAREQGCPLRRVAPHANHAPPPRRAKPNDPGPRVWVEVVVPVAVEQGLDLAIDWTTGGAPPWARRWTEAAT